MRRRTFTNKHFKFMTKQQSSRLTPPGELLTEMLVSPSDNFLIENASLLSTSKRTTGLSFQSFGIHSSNIAAASPSDKTTNGFHSFNPQITENAKAEVVKPAANFSLVFDQKFEQNNDAVNDKQQFSTSLLIICLLVALLFFTGLAFAATYFFEEKSVAPPSRETSSVNKSTQMSQTFFNHPPNLVSLNLSSLNVRKVCR